MSIKLLQNKPPIQHALAQSSGQRSVCDTKLAVRKGCKSVVG